MGKLLGNDVIQTFRDKIYYGGLHKDFTYNFKFDGKSWSVLSREITWSDSWF